MRKTNSTILEKMVHADEFEADNQYGDFTAPKEEGGNGKYTQLRSVDRIDD